MAIHGERGAACCRLLQGALVVQGAAAHGCLPFWVPAQRGDVGAVSAASVRVSVVVLGVLSGRCQQELHAVEGKPRQALRMTAWLWWATCGWRLHGV
jgi:hypothetical protein